ncbi:MAG: hypothetical protein R6X18_15320, partial [Chloroflexota bacterium]
MISFDLLWGFYASAAVIAGHVVAALLLFSLLRPGKVGADGKKRNRKTALSVLLGIALVAKALHTQYWLIIWDSTYDPFELFWLHLILLPVFLIWCALALAVPDRFKPLALSLVVVMPVLILSCDLVAQRSDFRQLTTARAESVNRAIEAYHRREGHYPDSLRRLTFREGLLLPEPVTLPGQNWCYDGSADFYQLGYVDRNHWSDPNLFGHLHDTGGEVSDRPPLCASEIATLRYRHPGYFGLRQE